MCAQIYLLSKKVSITIIVECKKWLGALKYTHDRTGRIKCGGALVKATKFKLPLKGWREFEFSVLFLTINNNAKLIILYFEIKIYAHRARVNRLTSSSGTWRLQESASSYSMGTKSWSVRNSRYSKCSSIPTN